MATNQERRLRVYQDVKTQLEKGRVLSSSDLINLYRGNGYDRITYGTGFDQEVWTGRFFKATGMEVTTMLVVLPRRRLISVYYNSQLNLATETDFLKKYPNVERVIDSYSVVVDNGQKQVREKSWVNLLFDYLSLK